jgi:hypothetical protein
MSATAQIARVPVDMRYSSRTIAGIPASFVSARAEGKVVYKLIRTSRLYEQIVQQIEESIALRFAKP